LWELGRLYTGAISDLALLKSSVLASDPHNEVMAYLNGLVIRVHGAIYQRPSYDWNSLSQFLVRGFPGAVRRNFVYVVVSAALFFLFGVTGFVLGLGEPGFIELVVPDEIIGKVEKGKVWFKGLYTMAPHASGWLVTHNVSVIFLIVAAGITFGLGTAYLLALNGILLGAVAALCFKHSMSLEFWSFVLPHASLEVSALVIAGAAGLNLGHALIDPGPYRRSEFLSVRSREVVRLALGCVPLLMLAGVIEAFFSPSPAPSSVKLIAAGLTFVSLLAYLTVMSMKKEESPTALMRP
jgi:uncharacterized membrane protein SpoIIM required for sporulation